MYVEEDIVCRRRFKAEIVTRGVLIVAQIILIEVNYIKNHVYCVMMRSIGLNDEYMMMMPQSFIQIHSFIPLIGFYICGPCRSVLASWSEWSTLKNISH